MLRKGKRAYIKAIVENRFRELGATQLELYPSGVCWTLNGAFFIDPMPYDISKQEIIRQADEALL